MVTRYDASKLAKAERTSQGFLKVDGRMARTGVLTYRMADGSTVRELRMPEEVFSPASLSTVKAGVPITVGHRGTITADNARTLKVGQTVTDATPEEGRYVSAKLQIEDPEAIRKIDTGELVELSAGYQVDLDPTPGIWQGQQYDAVQRNVRWNHLAIIGPGQGRSGADVSLRLDSADGVLIDEGSLSMNQDAIKLKIGDREHEMTKALADAWVEMQTQIDSATKSLTARDATIADQAAKLDAFLKAAAPKADSVDPKDLETKLGAAETRADQAEKRAATLESQIRTDAEAAVKDLDQRVDARIQLVDAARKVLGKDFDAKGKTDRQVREAVLIKAGQVCEGRSDAWIEGAFEFAAKATPGSLHALASVVGPPSIPPKADTKDKPASAEEARAARIKANQDAYKRPNGRPQKEV